MFGHELPSSLQRDRLVFWLRYYDQAWELYHIEDKLTEDILHDNMRIDAFFIAEMEKQKKKKRAGQISTKLAKHKNVIVYGKK